MSLKTSPQHRHHYVAAMFLGTALSTLAPTPASAAAEIPESSVATLSRYCTACWRNAHLPADCWNDCTQEVLTRLLQRIPRSRWDRLLTAHSDERRELVRAIDTVKKRTSRQQRRCTSLNGVLADRRSAQEQEQREIREEIRQASARLLSLRQQHILRLSCDGCSVQDIARNLAVSPERVSDEKYKAIRKLREHFHPDC